VYVSPVSFVHCAFCLRPFEAVIYPEKDEATPRMCLRLFDRYLAARASSMLDIGCGTGRDINERKARRKSDLVPIITLRRTHVQQPGESAPSSGCRAILRR
jgi:hypothetical protein